MVEPFGFKDDFNLVWAFDTGLKKNRQFKICRIQNIAETLIDWQFAQHHQSLPVDVFRNTGVLKKQVEFGLNLRAHNLLKEKFPLAEKYISAVGSNQFAFNAPVAKYEGPARFVLGIAEDVQLVGHVKQKNENRKLSFFTYVPVN